MKSALSRQFSDQIIHIEIHPIMPRLKMEFSNSNRFYIRCNDYGEYSYQIQFSNKLLDRVRFDNFDEKWGVSSSPHHFHLRGKKEVGESRMNGLPDNDLPLLIEYLKQFTI